MMMIDGKQEECSCRERGVPIRDKRPTNDTDISGESEYVLA